MTALKFRAYDGENFWYFTPDVGVFYKHFGGEQSGFDDPLEFSEVIDKGWPVDQWAGLVDKDGADIYCKDRVENKLCKNTVAIGIYTDKCRTNFEAFGVYLLESKCNILDVERYDKFKVIGNTHEDGE